LIAVLIKIGRKALLVKILKPNKAFKNKGLTYFNILTYAIFIGRKNPLLKRTGRIEPYIMCI